MAALTLQAVRKIYNPGTRHAVDAVKSLDMEIADGEIIGLLGSSGCGKTSTLRMVAGLESISDGEVRIGERRINELPAAQRNVAMAFEGYALYPPLKVRDNIGFSLLRNRIARAEVKRRVEAVAELLQIGDLLERYPPTLSGGQQQRVSLARALVRTAEADLHLLDEPMSQLEPQLRAVLRARIKDYLIQQNMTTVFVTHDQTEAVALADRIAVMENGELMQFDTPEGLRERPANLFVASFIGEPPMNIVAARVDSDADAPRLCVTDDGDGSGRGASGGNPSASGLTLDLAGLALAPPVRGALRPDRRISLGVRPHKLSLGGDGGADRPPPGLRLQGNVVSSQWLGDQTHVGVEVDGTVFIAVSGGDLEAPLNSRVDLTLPAADLHLFDQDTGRALAHGLLAADDR